MKVLIVEDDPLHRSYLHESVNAALPECSAVIEAASGGEGEVLARQHDKAHIVMDLQMQPRTGIEAARTIWRERPGTRILFWSNYADEAYVRGVSRIVPDGAAYGYVDMGGWVGGQAEYVMIPYADFNLLKFPNRDQALEKIKDLTLLSDIFPTGFHGAVSAGVGPGSIVYVAGAGPVGLACAASCHLLGAAIVIVGDMIPERLAQARSFGCETIDLRKDATLAQQIEQIVGVPEVDAAVDCVGFEARGHGGAASVERPATVLNSIMEVTRAGGSLGIPGLYVTGDPGGVDDNAKIGMLGIRIGLGWAKSHHFTTGQCPVMRYHRSLMQCILHDKIQIAKATNVTVVTLDQAVNGYKDFDSGAAKKYVLDPHGMIKR